MGHSGQALVGLAHVKQFMGNQDSGISKSMDHNEAFAAFGYLVLSTYVV